MRRSRLRAVVYFFFFSFVSFYILIQWTGLLKWIDNKAYLTVTRSLRSSKPIEISKPTGRPARTVNLGKSKESKPAELRTSNLTKLKESKKPIETKVIDMVNDYEPYVDFKLVFPEIMPIIENSEDIFLVILVNSGAHGEQFRSRRKSIRETWGNHKTCEQLRISRDAKLKSLKWVLVFVLGKSGLDNDKQNAQEATEHNDMIIGNINDNYINNVNKLFMGQLWAVTLHPKYTLKTDDDVYVRIPGVLEYLVKQNLPRPFYGGRPYLESKVQRIPGGKWSISRKYYAKDVFPTFNGGSFIILSSDLHNRLFNYVHFRKPFHTDDAYLGVAMNDLNVKATPILSFVVKYNLPVLLKNYVSDCKFQATVAFGHDLDYELLQYLHRSFESMCARNFTIASCKLRYPIY